MAQKKHLIIPDTQVRPGVPLEHLDWCGKYIVEQRPDVVVMLGDFADMESLCSYDKGKKSFEGRRYKKDIEVVHEGMDRLLAPVNKMRGKRPHLVMCLGNHEDRITRATEADAALDGTISLGDLGYEAYGWEVHPYLEPVKLDGVMYSHYFPSGVMGHPCTTARAILSRYHMSCVAGHLQGRDIAYAKRADGTAITAIIAGSYYLHEEAYLAPINNKHWRGLYVLHEVHKGSFDEMAVSIAYLRRRYG